MEPSDLVQQTLLEAYQKREQFRGASEGERAAWLRTILARNVADAMRAQGRLKRDASRERSLERELAESSARLGDWLAAEGPRPASLPSGTSRPFDWPMRLSACRFNQREALVLHYWQGFSLAEVAAHLDRTTSAVAGLLKRGLKNLREQLGGPGNTRWPAAVPHDHPARARFDEAEVCVMIVPASPANADSAPRDQRLDEALAEYLLAAEAGRTPDRREFLARHPDLAGDLASFFNDEDCVRRMAGSMNVPSREALAPGAVAAAHCAGRAGSGAASRRPDRRLRAARGDRRRRHGGHLQGPAEEPGPRRGAQDDPARGPPAGDDAARRFRIEAEAVARLDHPSIVPIYEMGEHRGSPFLCLKLIEGVDLERHLDRLRPEPSATARLMADVARAVHYAHQRGILHRDLKPSNILIDRRGRPHVTDFGLARSLGVDSRMTQTGQILGTPSYMAPEQVSGPRGEVTTAADVYGLGAVLYTLLGGRPPFQADTVYETLRLVREQEPAPRACARRASIATWRRSA